MPFLNQYDQTRICSSIYIFWWIDSQAALIQDFGNLAQVLGGAQTKVFGGQKNVAQASVGGAKTKMQLLCKSFTYFLNFPLLVPAPHPIGLFFPLFPNLAQCLGGKNKSVGR